MQGKYILLALIVFLVIMPLGEATTKKISPGAPVFVGESDVDIAKSLDNCRIISWWPAGADMSEPAGKSITLRAQNEISTVVNHYSFSPAEFGDYTGTWYCGERKPLKAVFVVQKPQVTMRVWNLDTDTDASGTTLPATANITYRIETNLDSALQLKYRPELTPADSFWTVTLTDPKNRGITNIYTGSYGSANTQILTFDGAPQITASPYQWRSGSSWNRLSRGAQGELVYPAGKYTFTASQNLNGMQAAYKSGGIADVEGLLTHSAEVNFVQAALVPSTTTLTPAPEITADAPETPMNPEMTVTVTALPTEIPETPVPEKTTYAPLPGWVALAGLLITATFIAKQRR